jgi:hypothetical protein
MAVKVTVRFTLWPGDAKVIDEAVVVVVVPVEPITPLAAKGELPPPPHAVNAAATNPTASNENPA